MTNTPKWLFLRSMKTAEIRSICDNDKRLYEAVADRFKRKLISLPQAVVMLKSVVSDREYFEQVGINDFLRTVAKS